MLVWCVYVQCFCCLLALLCTYLLVCTDCPISEHWVRAHPDCHPIYGVADGVHYVDILYEKLMGMQSAFSNCVLFMIRCNLECMLPLLLPLPFITGDSKNKWAVYDFQCYSSCVEKTGLQRKRKAASATRFPPLRLVLQLVYGPQFQQLGRDGIDIRVCACPGRDRGVDTDGKRKGKAKGKATGPPSPSMELRSGKYKGKGKGKAKTAAPPSPKPHLVPSTGW